MVRLRGEVVAQFERFSLYNSPFPAHDRGCAIDLYPGGVSAPSPVAGEVVETRTVRCPSKAYAEDHDHLVVVDCGEHVARLLHVDPAVEAGDRIVVGDNLGRLVRSGFFGRWVDEHLHLGFRDPDQNPHRAAGSLRLDVDVEVAPLDWDGTGTVVETGPAHALLDAPAHPGSGFAALASDEGVPLDGGLVHYPGGGALGRVDGSPSLLGTDIGDATGRDLAWADLAVVVNGRRATGLSLFASRVAFGAKLVFHRGHDLSVDDAVEVAVRPTSEPIHLG